MTHDSSVDSDSDSDTDTDADLSFSTNDATGLRRLSNTGFCNGLLGTGKSTELETQPPLRGLPHTPGYAGGH